MKPIQWFTSALLVSAMAMPCAMAQGFYEGNGAANLPSQRIVNEAPGGTGAALTLSPATVRRVQQELNRLGYNAGPVSGSWDRMTSIAVADFQRAHGLSPVGTLDEATIRMLGVGIGGGEVAGAGGGARGYPGMNGAYGGVNGGYVAGMERGYGMNGANGAGEGFSGYGAGGYRNGAGMNGAYGGNRVNVNPSIPGIGLSAGNISGANGSGNGASGAGGGVNGNSAETVNGRSGSTGVLNAGSGAGTLSGAAGTATTGAAPER